ncbi:hypothetical protein C8A03DRAFT_17858 [Achaetomium macrosporum]|uniref:Zn(2)-C6 fungal-type domain-containing protein n=1 Tax=Achaetomium macrosporum TaxID=79813 RepID=A0AAN7C4U9_9PEZI|nr:hypothetical protein C8A03DRAFT_17858 [Achaetomium macrosporum]
MTSLSGNPSTSTPFPMRTRRQRTCIPCAKAKRKCDKTVPFCIRCAEKEISCIYPARRGAFASFARPGNLGAAGEATILSPQGGKATKTAAANAPVRQDSSSAAADATVAADYRWFLSPASWTPQHRLCSEEPPVGERALPHFINKLKSWAEAWVCNGHSPLMHRELYRSWMPECVEEAYICLAAYNMASAASSARQTALRIIEERCSQLVELQQQSDDLSPCLLAVDTLTHLARTQALFVYQLIRLFDGDIRARAQAECQMDILDAWARQMLESARLDCMAAELLPSTDTTDDPGDMLLLPNILQQTHDNPELAQLSMATTSFHDSINTTIKTQPPLLWRAWITAESIRRIYLVATFMQSVYRTLKQGWSACPGGAAFTALQGLWDAQSGYEWTGILERTGKSIVCKEGEGGQTERGLSLSPWVMVQSLEAWRILREGRWEEVDEFTKGLLEICYGVERVEGWRSESGAGSG